MNNKCIFFPKTIFDLKTIIGQQISKYGNECNLNNIDTSKIIDMNSLFLKSNFNEDISKWNISNVINMTSMFHKSNIGNIAFWYPKLNPKVILKNFGTFRGYNINSYDDFKIYYKQTTLDLL